MATDYRASAEPRPIISVCFGSTFTEYVQYYVPGPDNCAVCTRNTVEEYLRGIPPDDLPRAQVNLKHRLLQFAGCVEDVFLQQIDKTRS